jgi:hypothetical protein
MMQNAAPPESSSLRWDGVTASPRADMRVEGARHPRGAGDGGIPEDIRSGSAETRPRGLREGTSPKRHRRGR